MDSKRSSLAANLILALSSTVMTLLLFGFLEGSLRILGIGQPDGTSRLKYQQIYLPVMEPAVLPDGTPVFATGDVRLPYQTIRQHKPENALRIFTFGGSATAGLGYSPNVTFTRHLERLLEMAHPDRVVEVVNLGIVALASDQVRVLVADVCRNYEPDALVVYSGNNEFLEVHAEKFAAANATPISRIAESLMQTHVYRLANRAVRGSPQKPSLAEQRFSNDDLRVTQDSIIKHIHMELEEVEEIVDHYASNVDAIARVAVAADTPLVLMTVASNWKYRGRKDLPTGWLDDVLGAPGAATHSRYRAALEVLGQTIATGDPMERWEAMYRVAAAHEVLGDYEAARRAYRRSMNEDPHLRRALDAMAQRVREGATDPGVHLFDTIALLQGKAEHGIVGFDEFYDYVHFTPRGALLVGAAIFSELQKANVVPEAAHVEVDAYVAQRLGRLETLSADALELGEWMGVDPASMTDRDLWKYERIVKQLDRQIDEQPDDPRALVYRANANYFRIDGAEAALRDYRAALALDAENAVIRANLEALLSERRPGS